MRNQSPGFNKNCPASRPMRSKVALSRENSIVVTVPIDMRNIRRVADVFCTDVGELLKERTVRGPIAIALMVTVSTGAGCTLGIRRAESRQLPQRLPAS